MARGVIPAPLGVIKRYPNVGTGGKTFTVANGARFILFTLSSSANGCGIYFMWATNTGAVGYETVNAASIITITTGTNTFTATPSSGTSLMIIFDFTDGIS